LHVALEKAAPHATTGVRVGRGVLGAGLGAAVGAAEGRGEGSAVGSAVEAAVGAAEGTREGGAEVAPPPQAQHMAREEKSPSSYFPHQEG
jgi:hypothetical protein